MIRCCCGCGRRRSSGRTAWARSCSRHLALHERQLAEYREIEERGFTPAPTTAEDRLRYLVLRGGIDLETFWIGWLTRAIADLDD